MKNRDSRRQVNDLVFTSLLGIISDIQSYRSGWAERKNDMSTLVERYAYEGRGFLSVGLSSLGKSVDKALQGTEPLCCEGFKVRRLTCLPDFLHELFMQVFDPEDGFVLPPSEVNPLALRELRQVLFYAYKEEFPFTRDHQAAAVHEMRTVDSALPDDNHVVEPDVKRVLEYAARLVGDVLRDFDPKSIVPGHGPGSVATYEKPYEKMDFRRVYASLDAEYPYVEYFTLGRRHLWNDKGHQKSLCYTRDAVSRMAIVPKDARGPRKISLEPLEIQWMQQGLKKALYDWFERHPLTKGKVNFTDQGINQRHAIRASLKRNRDTVDLKDASDRNSLWLVRQVWKYAPRVLTALEATRSTHMRLLDGTTLRLRKFAPMGSAVCFPVEALTFWALTVACLAVISRLPAALTRHVWVYGDDIILPHGHLSDLDMVFTAVGLKINLDKTCSEGYFRESCGVDAFYGNDVTPLKIKLSPPSTRSAAANIVSWVERGNMFYAQGYHIAAMSIWDHVERLVGKLPCLPLDAPDVGFLHKRMACECASFSRKTRLKWDPDIQSWVAEVWTWKAPVVKASPLRIWSALLLSLTKRSEEEHATDWSTLPKSLRLCKSWVCLHGMPIAVSV